MQTIEFKCLIFQPLLHLSVESEAFLQSDLRATFVITWVARVSHRVSQNKKCVVLLRFFSLIERFIHIIMYRPFHCVIFTHPNRHRFTPIYVLHSLKYPFLVYQQTINTILQEQELTTHKAGKWLVYLYIINLPTCINLSSLTQADKLLILYWHISCSY